MELRQLYYFVKVAKKEHVTQAAEELRVAQSAVSRQIHQLEEELGVSLFIQKGRNLQLTPAGQLFLKRIEVVLGDLEKAVLEINEFMNPEVGEIRLGFPHSLGIQLIPQVVSGFRKQYPHVRFKFKQGMYPSLIRDLVKGEIDLAFISPFPEHNEHVVGEVLLTEELYAVLPAKHALADKKSIMLSELKDDEFVMFREGYSLRPIVWEACKKAGFTPSIGFEGEETETIRGLVAAGMGVSLLPEMALHQAGPLQTAKVRIESPSVTRTIGLIRRSNQKLPLVAKVFYKYLLDHFSKECKSL